MSAANRPAAILLDPNDGCLRIARALVRRGIEVHVIARPRAAYVTRSRKVKGAVLPDLPDGREAWLARLGELSEQGAAVLIPGSDHASEFLVEERSAIPAMLRSFESPSSSHLRVMNKAELYEVARTLGVRTAWTLELKSRQQLDAAADEATYPCIVKPALAHLAKALGRSGTLLVRDAGELQSHARPAVDEGIEMLVSELVPGGEENLEGAVTVRAADGSFPLVYGRRKIRQYPLDFGPGSLTCSAAVPEAIEIAQRLLDEVGFVGVSGFEAKRHAETGELVLIEINVRVVQSFGLGDACGTDASWRLYATLAGIPLGPQPPQRDGIKVVSPAFELLAASARLRRGDVSLGELLRSYRGTREVGVLDPRDPAPALELARWVVRARARRLGTRIGHGRTGSRP